MKTLKPGHHFIPYDKGGPGFLVVWTPDENISQQPLVNISWMEMQLMVGAYKQEFREWKRYGKNERTLYRS